MPQTLLVIDPDPALLRELESALAGEGDGDLRFVRADDAAEALPRLDEGWVDVVLCDPRLPGLDGYDIVPQIRRRLPRATVVLTDVGDPEELARGALARGVREVLPRPIAPAAALLVLQRAREAQHRFRSLGLLHRELRRALGDRPVVAASTSMIAVLEAVERVAGRVDDVLVRGEPGTGKESIARAIHAQSIRHEGPFVALACEGAGAEHLESELFGRARSGDADSAPARRGLLVEARGGTLFLDEIGALPQTLQVRLVHALDAGASRAGDAPTGGAPDLRVVASTQRDLDREAKAGRFESTLLARFEEGRIEVPPLRERRADIPLLADHILARLAAQHGRGVRAIADDALACLSRHAWPGNVRELENTLERALLVGDGARIEVGDLPDVIQRADGGELDVWELRAARRAAETAAIRRALRATGGNRTHAARRLRISQRALLYKLKEYGIRD
ncbi:MAG: sigma-54 dependent transcriptional regulator [Myxococcota bacterium]